MIERADAVAVRGAIITGACDGRGRRRTAKPCGSGTLCWCSSCTKAKSPNRVTSRKAFDAMTVVTVGRRGERDISR